MAEPKRRWRRRVPKPVFIDRRPPELAEADRAVRAAEEALYKALDDRRKMAVKAVNENLPYDLEEGRAPFEDHYLKTDPFHRCHNSPLGHCVYDSKEDPCSDDCLYCHEPLERK